MAKTLFIFGAGASKPGGAPVMADFLDRAMDLWRRPPAGVALDQASFNTVFEAFRDLRRVRLNTLLPIENIETFFSAVEMARLVNRFPGRTGQHVDELHSALVTYMVQTIEYTMPFRIENGRVRPNGDYRQFVQNLRELRDKTEHRDFSFITFNYDIALDYALHFNALPFDYWLPGQERTAGAYPLLKLHGSINWATCMSCHAVIPLGVDFVGKQVLIPGIDRVFLDLGERLALTKHCDQPLAGPSFLVPPTLGKAQYQQQLEQIWKTAAKTLAEAENIFVIGYSLPSADLFFRYLLGLGLESGTTVRRFWVFDPDESHQVQDRFREFIGPSLLPRFKVFGGGAGLFLNALETIQRELTDHS